jgi:photosystem I reaction center subunit XII
MRPPSVWYLGKYTKITRIHFMAISDAQVLTALAVALFPAVLAVLLGSALYNA